MGNKTIADCPTCGYPLSAEYSGQTRVCEYCKTSLIAGPVSAIPIPTPLFVGVIAFGLGVFLGPSLLASTEAGQNWLAKKAREKIR